MLGVLSGLWSGADSALYGLRFYAIYEFFGNFFLNALKMLIVPLIVSSIIVGISGVGVGAQGSLGRMGAKTLLYYLVTSTLAILLGLILVNVIQPGIVDGMPANTVLGLSADTASVVEKVEDRSAGDLVGVFLRMVPPNIVKAAAEGQMLGLIVFSLLFGYFMTQIQRDCEQILKSFWQGVFEVMMRITDLVMKFAPIGVFALVAKVVAVSGVEAFRPLATFFFTVLMALAVHLFVIMPLILKLVGGGKAVAPLPGYVPCLVDSVLDQFVIGYVADNP